MLFYCVLLCSLAVSIAQINVFNDLQFVSEFRYPAFSFQALRVYEVQSPPDSTLSRKFMHDPAFLPSATCSTNTSKIACCHEIPSGQQACELVVLLSSPAIKDAALLSLSDNNDKTISLKDIVVKPVSAVKLEESEIHSYFGYASLAESLIPIRNGEDQFTVTFVLPSRLYVERFENDIKFSTLSYSAYYSGLKIEKNIFKFKWTDLQITPLYNALNGIAQSTELPNERVVYVHRDDLRLLALESFRSLTVNYWIEKPASYFKNKVDDFYKNFPVVSTESTKFTDTMWAHTYNENDLRPDNLKSYFYNKMDDVQQSYESSTSFGGDSVGLLSSAGFDFSDDEAQSFRERHEVNLKKEGNIWIPRSVNVRAVNLNKFSSSDTVFQIEHFVEPATVWQQGRMQISKSLSSHSFSYVQDLEKNIRDLYGVLQSKKLIIMWSGNNDTFPTGWTECDGTNDTPNLVDRIPRGAGTEIVGSEGGSDTATLDVANLPPHDHCHEDFCQVNRPPSNNGWAPHYAHSNSAREFEGRHRMSIVGEAKPFPILPSYTSVHFLCQK